MSQKIFTLALIAMLFALSFHGALFLTLSFSAEAQQPSKTARIGILSNGSSSLTSPLVYAFRERLHEFGYVEGKHICLENRYADGKLERLRDLAAELVRLNLDVIFTTVLQRF